AAREAHFARARSRVGDVHRTGENVGSASVFAVARICPNYERVLAHAQKSHAVRAAGCSREPLFVANACQRTIDFAHVDLRVRVALIDPSDEKAVADEQRADVAGVTILAREHALCEFDAGLVDQSQKYLRLPLVETNPTQ